MDFLEYADITSEVNGAMVNNNFIINLAHWNINRYHNL